MKRLGSTSRKVSQSLQKLMLNFCFVIQPHSGLMNRSSWERDCARLVIGTSATGLGFFSVSGHFERERVGTSCIAYYSVWGYMKYLPKAQMADANSEAR